MSRPARVVIALLASYLVMAVGGVVLGDAEEAAVWALLAMAFASPLVAGTLIMVFRPDNRIGWLFCVIGVAFAASIFLSGYGYRARVDGWPGGDYAAWLGSVAFLFYWVPVILLLLLFPTGFLPSPRWRPVVALVVGGAALTTIGRAFGPTSLEGAGGLVPNPFAAPGWLGPILVGLAVWANVGLIALVPVGSAALLLRLRRSKGVERQQLKLFVFAGTLVSGVIVISTLLPDPLNTAAYAVALIAIGAGLPITAVIAILRYRLYEIDLIISRTVGWALVTAGVIAIYLGAVLLLQGVLSGITQGELLAVAVSTLLAAAAVQPLRRRTQGLVDRRFHRARYDAERTAAAFTERLRDEVGLESIGRELMETVTATLRPVSAAVWLRGAAGPARWSTTGAAQGGRPMLSAPPPGWERS